MKSSAQELEAIKEEVGARRAFLEYSEDDPKRADELPPNYSCLDPLCEMIQKKAVAAQAIARVTSHVSPLEIQEKVTP
ncbi:hypothetical protein NDU88_007066 [Pleurodeles waltl]|uniref:Uncharacterized protein n=1 Tax=Pleurodeles waltl TaxID=8319 RepID=A0AAV7TYT1_PLEWA|nr:hypothetical protein NDU88_007066 [Pleurodeles waltl]